MRLCLFHRRRQDGRHSQKCASPPRRVSAHLGFRHFFDKNWEVGLCSKLLLAAKDFPIAQFFGITHLRKLWRIPDLKLSARPGGQFGGKLQVRPFTSIFSVEDTFAFDVSAVGALFLLGIDDTLLQLVS